MALPKVLSPGFWLDKVLRIFLKLVLAILLHVLYLIKGEQEQVHVRKVEVTVKNVPNNKNNKTKDNKTIKDNINDVEIIKNNITKPIDVFNITGTLIELKPDELDENLIEKKEISMPIILNTINDIITNKQPDNKKEEYQSSIDEDDESVKEEYQSSIDEDDESVKEEEELFQNIYHNVSSFEMKTSHDYRSNITKKSNIIPFEFHWKHGGNRVFITGDFDNWSACKHEMSRIPKTNDFVAIIDIDCTKQHDFKFVVDGEWKFNWDLETRYDEHGNINNFIYAAPTSDSLNPEYNDNVGFLNSHFTAAY
nr:7588_t:CDS:2 [Entrophospora candida]